MNLLEQASRLFLIYQIVLMFNSNSEMTNLYMSAWPNDPIVRGAIMQSSDSKQGEMPSSTKP